MSNAVRFLPDTAHMARYSVALSDLDEHAVAEHLEYLRLAGYADTSRYARQRALIRLVDDLTTDLLEASEQDLMEWRRALTVEADTAAHYVAHVREFYAWTFTAGHRSDNPASRLPSPKTRRRLPRPIAEEDLAYAVHAADERVRPWLVLAGWAGLRAKEIAYLRREDVTDAGDSPTLLITEAATKGCQERVVPLSPFVLSELHAAGLPRSGYVFRRRDGRRGPNRPWLVSQMCNRHLKECGIGASLHQLRHRFGTQTYRSSHDLRLVQDLLGHASPITTAGYAAYDRSGAATTVDSLPTPGLQSVRKRTG